MIRRRIPIWLHSLRAHEGGAQVVELALTLPVLLAVFCGVMECGRILFTHAALNFAAQEATRYATVNYNATIEDIKTIAKNRLIVIDPNKVSGFQISSELDPIDQTKLVTVEIAYAFQPILPIGLNSFMMTGHSRGFLVDRE